MWETVKLGDVCDLQNGFAFKSSLFKDEGLPILRISNIQQEKVDTQKIYLFAEILDKRSKLRNYFEREKDCITVACYPDNEITIKKIINNKLKGFIGLNPENINMITDACSLDRNKLKEQLDKTISYFRDKKINNDKLEDILGIKENVDFNYLKDEALNGNKINTNKLLSETILESEKNVYYLALINQRLNKLHEIYKLSNGSNMENSINMLKPPIFWKEKQMFLLQAKKWNLNKIKRVLNKTYKLEIEIKSNPYVNKDLLIKKLIVDMCQLANAS